jgi:hypothetical protein
MNNNDLKHFTDKEIYFGKYINDNVIDLDISPNLINIQSFLNNYNIIKKSKVKIYIYNNMFYEIKDKKHTCYRKDNLIEKEYKDNNKIVTIYAFNKKYLSTDIFPSIINYLNEEEFEEINYENGITVKNIGDKMIIYLNHIDKNLINMILKLI